MCKKQQIVWALLYSILHCLFVCFFFVSELSEQWIFQKSFLEKTNSYKLIKL